MRVIFQTYEKFINILHTDFTKLSTLVNFPCQIESDFKKINELVNPNGLAQTFYGKKLDDKLLPPRIEFSPDYFGYEDSDRIIILLHEIIHAYQRQDSLLDYNQNLTKNLTNYRKTIRAKMITEKEKNPDNPDLTEIEILDQKFKSIYEIMEVPFEIWNDIFFKLSYEDLFDQNMKLNFNNISGYIPQMGQFKKTHRKYKMFKEILRTNYLSKINIGCTMHQSFSNLHDEWMNEFQIILEHDVRSVLENYIEPLTNIEDYPNSSVLTHRYEDFIVLIWENNS